MASESFKAFAAVKSNFGTSAATGELSAVMTNQRTSDTSGTNSIIPLRRQNNATGFSNYYANISSYEVNMGCNQPVMITPYLVSSVFRINTVNDTLTGQLRETAAVKAVRSIILTQGTPHQLIPLVSISFILAVAQRCLAGSGTDYFNGDYAEIVV